MDVVRQFDRITYVTKCGKNGPMCAISEIHFIAGYYMYVVICTYATFDTNKTAIFG